MTATKYVIEVLFEDPSAPNGVSQWVMQRAIETALRTLGQKKHKLGKIRNVFVEPLSGSLAMSVELVRALRQEAEDAAYNRVSEHEDSYQHDRDCYGHD